MKDNDIKRMLSVGMTTLSDRLREYKDPFEPRELELTLAPIEIDRFVVHKQACAAQNARSNPSPDSFGTHE